MELKLDEQILLVDFRRLNPEGKTELLDYASFLVKKYQEAAPEELPSTDQCPVRKQEEERPEAAKEPIFTE